MLRGSRMHVHVLGICGTFMGSLALLARELGHKVTGSDANVYPPMSTQLEQAGIALMEGFSPEHLQPSPDLVVIGNALSRGNPAVEYVLNKGLRYTSGPGWLRELLPPETWVLGVSGTHGKTTTTSLLAWLLEAAGMSPGFLVGGVPKNFGVSARMGGSPFFVVEADEYDTAFFDKRSKFVHYRPRTLIINNLEYDHADIFPDLAAIQTQFHHVVRTVPGEGTIIAPLATPAVEQVLARGCWSPVQHFNTAFDAEGDWYALKLAEDGSVFEVFYRPSPGAAHVSAGVARWSATGDHSVCNALAAIAAARTVGVRPEQAVQALATFEGVKRRMECLGERNGVAVYDDFAHHPTAIETTLNGLRAKGGQGRILAVIEPRSNTMKLGSHQALLGPSTAAADQVFWYQPANLSWSVAEAVSNSPVPAQVLGSTEAIIQAVVAVAKPGDQVVVMSNGGFEGIHHRLLDALGARA